MCFSTSASFTATAFLIPTGIYACQVAIKKDFRYLSLALIPCIFGIQQGLEGLEWLGLLHHQANLTHLAALGYLFFSHWFWLPWLGLAIWMITKHEVVRTIVGAIAVGLTSLSRFSVYCLVHRFISLSFSCQSDLHPSLIKARLIIKLNLSTTRLFPVKLLG